jgi:hypothetical protein
MTGYGIIGLIFSADSTKANEIGDAIVTVLSGHADTELLSAFYTTFSSDPPSCITDLEIGRPQLDALKARVRLGVQLMVDDYANELREEAQKRKTHAANNFLSATSQAHELGTVNEIAQKYNISKSEVRRRKADGTLSDYIRSLSA